MTLENLVGKSLEKVSVDASSILKLLQAAEQSLQDSKIETISNDSRFDLAYKAVMQLSNAALQANGYRTLTSKPGHHQLTLIDVKSLDERDTFRLCDSITYR